MKTHSVAAAVTLAVACTVAASGCGPSTGPGQGSSTGSGQGGGAGGAKGPSVGGEILTPRVIADRQQGGMPIGVVAVPASWKFSSDVQWDYAHNSNPVTVASRAENPANEEAVFSYPAASFFYL